MAASMGLILLEYYSYSWIKRLCGGFFFSRGACQPIGWHRSTTGGSRQALPSTHLSGTQQQSDTSKPGRPAPATSHSTLNLRKALETQTQPDF
eukprot:scaffold9168_cov126-Isochrysis_galbana.AAC.3